MLVCVDCIDHARGLGKPAPGERGGARPRKIVSGVRKPRCGEHTRVKRAGASERQHGQRIEATYGVSQTLYSELYEAQGGRCAVCQWARGKTRRLAVDHDHSCCNGPTSCGKCVRGLLCDRCNRLVVTLGVAGLQRAIDYLQSSPAYSRYSGKEL